MSIVYISHCMPLVVQQNNLQDPGLVRIIQLGRSYLNQHLIIIDVIAPNN